MIFDFSDKKLFNEIYLPLLYDKNRYHILYGGRDSGKSDFVAQNIIMDMLENDYFRLILLRKYYASIKQSQFQTILDYIKIWELGDLFHVTINPLHIVCKTNHNQILARGLDQPDNTKSIKDPTAIWYEEADQISENSFTESSLSLRSSQQNVQLREWLTFNPRKEYHWINKLFFPPKHTYENVEADFHFVNSIYKSTTILHTNYKDNRFCTKERALRLEALATQDENLYKVNTLGIWGGALKGLIFPDWSFANEMPENGDEVFALDYGFNNPTALVHLKYNENKLYVDELLYITNHTHQQIVQLIISDFKSIINKNYIVVDSAAPELIKAMRQAGLNAIPAQKGSVYDGIIQMKQFDLYITKSSKNILKELQSYIWKENNDDNLIDEPVKQWDHSLDAIRYGIITYGKRYWQIINNSNRRDTHKQLKKINKYSNY